MKKFGFRQLMVFIILSATVGLCYLLPYLRYTFYDQMMGALMINDAQMGILTSVIGFTCMPCYILGGFFANKFSTRNLICITLIGFAAVTVWYAFTTDFIQLIIIFVLYGFFTTATVWSAYLSGIRNLGDESNQSKLFGSSEATRGITQTLLGFAFLGIMGVAATPTFGFRAVLLTGAGITLLLLVLALIFLPKEEKKSKDEFQEEIKREEEKYSLLDVIKSKSVWITILVLGCAYLSWAIGNNFITTYTVRVVGIDDSLATAIGIIRSYVIVVVGGFFGGWLLDKFTYKGTGFVVLFAIVAASILGIIFTSALIPLCVALTLVIAFVNNIMKSTVWSIMGQSGIPIKMTALATGFISITAFILPDIVAPMVGGLWLEEATLAGDVAVGFYKIFACVFIFAIIGIVGGIILKRRTQKLEAEGIAIEG